MRRLFEKLIDPAFKAKDQKPADEAIHKLSRSKARPLAQVILEAIRQKRSDRPPRPWLMPTTHPEEPHGPYKQTHPENAGDLLVFVPRSIESHLLDHATGAYGYSHVAVDCGEAELLTGERVIIESTVNHPVSRAYLDKYGPRPYIRIPLRRAGIDPGAFSHCVQSKLGQPYDDLEALTWGDVDDPAKQICSGLAADCFPELVRDKIADAYLSKKLRKRSVSVHHHRDGSLGIFVSPNAFAQYFGAPPGYKVDDPNVHISIDRKYLSTSQPAPGWKILVALGLSIGVAWLLVKLLRKRSVTKVRQTVQLDIAPVDSLITS